METKEENKIIIPAIPAVAEIAAREIKLPLYCIKDGEISAVFSDKKVVRVSDNCILSFDNKMISTLFFDKIAKGELFEPITKQEFEQALKEAISNIYLLLENS